MKESGGAVCGEVSPVAIFIRLLAGASYLDLMDVFDLSYEPIFRSFRMVCGWVMATFKYPLVKALEEENVQYFKDVSSSFAECGASNGVFRGCIGAVDGLAIKIKRPTLTRT